MVKWEELSDGERIKDKRKERKEGAENWESDNSRWLNAGDGRPARECILILLYKTVHAEQKQKEKNETRNVEGTGGRCVYLSVPSTCPYTLWFTLFLWSCSENTTATWAWTDSTKTKNHPGVSFQSAKIWKQASFILIIKEQTALNLFALLLKLNFLLELLVWQRIRAIVDRTKK